MKSKIIKLDNGGVLLYSHSKLCKSTAALVGFRVGAFKEQKMGTAHLLEHTLFKKTKSRTNAEVEADRSKISFLNASTSMDYIVLKFFRTNKMLEKTLDFTSDVLLNSVIDDEYFDTEKEVVKEELLMCLDSEQFDPYVKNFKQAVSGAKSASDIVGKTTENIDKIKFKDLVDFKQNYFISNNFICSVVSSLSAGKIKKLINKYFLEKLKFKENYSLGETYYNSAIVDKKSSLKIFNKTQEKVSVLMSFKFKATELEIFGKNYNYTFLARFLSGAQGELFLKLRNKGLIYRIDSDVSCFVNGSLFNILFETSKEKVKEIVDIIAEEINKIVSVGVDEKYIETYKNNLDYIDDEKFPTKPTVKCQVNMNDYLSFGKIFYLSKREKKLLRNGVSVNGVKQAAAEIFNKNGEVFVTVLGNAEKQNIPTLNYFKEKFLIKESL